MMMLVVVTTYVAGKVVQASTTIGQAMMLGMYVYVPKSIGAIAGAA